MKLEKTNNKEIERLMDLLNEIESIHKYGDLQEDFQGSWVIEKEDYPILHDLISVCEAPTDLIYHLFREFASIHHQRILWNLMTLLDNCADKELGYLDFNPKIKKSLGFLDKIAKIQKGSAPSAGYFQELIEEAESINNIEN